MNPAIESEVAKVDTGMVAVIAPIVTDVRNDADGAEDAKCAHAPGEIGVAQICWKIKRIRPMPGMLLHQYAYVLLPPPSSPPSGMFGEKQVSTHKPPT